MGLFNFFGKNSSQEDDLYFASSYLLWTIANSDNDFSNQEQDYFNQFLRTIPRTSLKSLDKLKITKGEEIVTMCTRLSDKNKSILLNKVIEMCLIDHNLEESELKILAGVCEAINADFNYVIELIKNNYNLDFNNQKRNKVEPILGFRSHTIENKEEIKNDDLFCTQCGTKNKNQNSFCTDCGAKMDI